MSFLSTRAAVRASALAAVAVAVSAAPAAARMYVATTTQLGGAAPTGSVEGYAYVAGVDNTDTFRLDVARGGALIATQTAQSYVALTPLAVQPGDTITLTDVTTAESHAVTVSGRPALDAGLCGAATAFAGDRDEGATVTVGASLSYGAGDPRNETLTLPSLFGAGTRFAGSFPKALGPDWVVTAKQARALDPAFTVFEAVSRPVGDCPPAPAAPAPAAPPAPAAAPAPTAPAPPPAKDVLPPAARLTLPASLRAAAYRALVAGRFVDRVAVTEPGAVTQTLYADDGARLPAASAAAARARTPTVLGTGRATVTRAGAVRVAVTLSRHGRAALKRRPATKVALVTVATDAAGNARVLAPVRFTVRRGR